MTISQFLSKIKLPISVPYPWQNPTAYMNQLNRNSHSKNNGNGRVHENKGTKSEKRKVYWPSTPI